MMEVRYDEERKIYRDCPMCYGVGCIHCPSECEKEYKRQFPDGPQPIATFKLDDPEDMEIMKRVFGKESIEDAFGDDGGGVAELLDKLAGEGR